MDEHTRESLSLYEQAQRKLREREQQWQYLAWLEDGFRLGDRAYTDWFLDRLEGART